MLTMYTCAFVDLKAGSTWFTGNWIFALLHWICLKHTCMKRCQISHFMKEIPNFYDCSAKLATCTSLLKVNRIRSTSTEWYCSRGGFKKCCFARVFVTNVPFNVWQLIQCCDMSHSLLILTTWSTFPASDQEFRVWNDSTLTEICVKNTDVSGTKLLVCLKDIVLIRDINPHEPLWLQGLTMVYVPCSWCHSVSLPGS